MSPKVPESSPSGEPHPMQVTLPSQGEALIPMKTFSGALGVTEQTGWEWLRTDPNFPQPIRRGERFTRFRLSEARDYIANLSTGAAKDFPPKRKRGTSEGSV